MSLHDRIMRLPEGQEVPDKNPQRSIYKTGHRDARHSAAELSLQADELMEEMAEALNQAITSMQDSGYPNDSVAVRAGRESIAKYNAYKEQ